MVQYVLKTMFQLAILVVGIVALVFLLIRLIPGDPAVAMLGDYATPDSIAQLHAQLGLD